MNKNDIYRLAVINRDLIIERNDPVQSLNTLIDALNEDQIDQLQADLARIYLAIFKASAMKHKNLSDWQALTIFAARKDVRSYLNYVYVDKNKIGAATNGCILIKTKRPMDLEPGFYDVRTGVKTHSLDDMKFPDLTKFLIPGDELDIKLDAPADVRTRTDGKKKFAEEYCYAETWFNADYIKIFEKVFQQDYKIFVSKVLAYRGLMLENNRFTAIIAPIRR